MVLWRVVGPISVLCLGCGSRTGVLLDEPPDASRPAFEAGVLPEAHMEAAPSLCSSYQTLEACSASGMCDSCRCGPCFNGSPDGGPCGPATIFVCLGPGDNPTGGDCLSHCPDGSTP